ncbi:hypothetical protein D3C78_1316160 [compost metagenome]
MTLLQSKTSGHNGASFRLTALVRRSEATASLVSLISDTEYWYSTLLKHSEIIEILNPSLKSRHFIAAEIILRDSSRDTAIHSMPFLSRR